MIDIVEIDQGVSMMLEMPGVAADAVEITLENRVLTIRGKVEPMRPENLELAYQAAEKACTRRLAEEDFPTRC